MLSKPHLINASLSCQEITHNGFVKPALWLQNFQVRYCPLSSQDTSGKGIGEGSLLAPKETGSPSPTLCLGRKQACCGFPSPGNQTLLFNSRVRTGLSGPGIRILFGSQKGILSQSRWGGGLEETMRFLLVPPQSPPPLCDLEQISNLLG